MQIELYKADKLGLKGSSLRSMIMNKDMPILDLLVRESIQNSLDAKDDSNPSKFVSVDFTVGNFNRAVLDNELEGISLSSRPLLGNRFLSIRDVNTVGLTGKYNDKKSNLYKLVYGIMEAQSASGAGGSWGIGKTVYFRVGIGLVLYYSRTKNANGGFDSLIAADLVEDETKSNALLPPVDGNRFGIAWWGKRVSNISGEVKETRDEATINRILDAFGLQPYTGKSTGTIIIIPFIDDEALLANNQPKLEEGQIAPFWTKSVKDYLTIAIQKWYSARIANRKYLHGKYLNATVNGKGMAPNDMEPMFKLTQALYNKASLCIAQSPEADSIQFADAEIKAEKIVVYSQINPNEAGYVAYTKVNRRQLGMCAPDNRPSPYEYINGTCDADSFGKPIILFSRKPGMAVSFETEGKWTSGIPATAEDEYIIAYFVINSTSMLTALSGTTSLEDYARKSELADHTSWEDCDLEGAKPTIIDRIRRSVSRKIAAAYSSKEEEMEKTENSGLSSLLGRILLPPEGFGKKPSSPAPSPGQATASFKNVRYSYSVESYSPSGMVLAVHASTGKRKSATFGAEIGMDSITGPIRSSVWEKEMGLEMPFYFNEVKLTVIKVDGEKIGSSHIITRDDYGNTGATRCSNIISDKGDWHAMSFTFDDGIEHSFEMDLKLVINVRRRDIKPVMTFEF